MVDFKYHVVSIMAVFLALAVGIVIGSSALNGRVLSDLQSRVDGLQTDRRDLQAQVGELQAQADSDAGFAAAVGPAVVSERLLGEQVVLVVADGASSEVVSDAQTAVLQAGGTVVTVRLSARWGSPGTEPDVDALLQRVTPSGTALPPGDSWSRASALLAAALLDPPQGEGALPADTAAEVVGAFIAAGYVDSQDDTVGGASQAVLAVAGVPDPELPEDPLLTQRLVALSLALDQRGDGAVIAGPQDAADGGPVAAVRADRSASAAVSTMAPSVGPQGAIALVLALVEQTADGSGQYGLGTTAQSAAPDVSALPAPQRSASPSPSPSGTPSAGGTPSPDGGAATGDGPSGQAMPAPAPPAQEPRAAPPAADQPDRVQAGAPAGAAAPWPWAAAGRFASSGGAPSPTT